MRNLAAQFECSLSTIHSTIHRFKSEGTARDRKRSGRPKTLRSDQTKRRVLRELQKNRWASYGVVAKDVGGLSRGMVRRMAVENGLGRYVPALKPFISQVNASKRLSWALDQFDQRWDNVIWTDETRLELGKHSGRLRVTRKKGEKYNPKYTLPNYASGRKSAMFWAAISYFGKSPLLLLHWPETVVGKNGKLKKGGFTNKEYAEQVLQEALPAFCEDQICYTGWEFEVVEDGAPVHKGPHVAQARLLYPFTNRPHPASSPDLNPIEHLWRILKTRVWEIPGSHNSLNNLIKAAREAWDAIPIEEVQNLIDSMPRRVQAVIDNKGHATKY
jgi:hypothetical protein